VTKLGRYHLIERIAVGGMAELYLAKQDGPSGFEKTVCIKRIRSHLCAQPEFVNMFLNEARLAALLNHPNIVQIYDLGQDGDEYFIAMEYVSGTNMSEAIKRANDTEVYFPILYALKIISLLCEALYHAHTKRDAYQHPLNLVHRDISPHNVLLAFDGSVKLSDFGIAKASTALFETCAGQIKGKLRYMSPEQLAGDELDGRSDVFSLGVMLHECLTGVPLFEGESDMALMKALREDPIYAPSYFNPNLGKDLDAVAMKALDRDVKKRYQSAWEMQRDLDAVLAHMEFVPTSMHLATYMKQLMSAEVAIEDARLGLLGAVPPSGEQTSDESGVDAVTIHLSKGDLAKLDALAHRHRLAPKLLLETWVREQLKWL
jgi:serine/threonine protein kinase